MVENQFTNDLNADYEGRGFVFPIVRILGGRLGRSK